MILNKKVTIKALFADVLNLISRHILGLIMYSLSIVVKLIFFTWSKLKGIHAILYNVALFALFVVAVSKFR